MIFYRIKRRYQRTAQWLTGFLRWHITVHMLRFRAMPIQNLNYYERKIYSQNREDGIINAIFTIIGTTNTYYVEFGAEDGKECNTRALLTQGWKGVLMDGDHENHTINLQKEFITSKKIEALFHKNAVPKEPDLLSIDIDGNDYWVWNEIKHYHPRVVIVEYNACLPYEPAVTIPYKEDFVWDKTDYYGASLSALVKLGKAKGYTLVATDSRGVNAFFIRNDIAASHFIMHPPEKLYRSAQTPGSFGGHPKDTKKRTWVAV
ncbi:hypothetical protein COU75_00185 [Candidatus Peregrinibacteria bacterium CG10_big_fil_rev_8_21_14_0_10_42_8]|nr:MAG: hypothetical protein COU75_00185 [Candidatus Peregrinibacteria bacterium CG10_big_fil_rev_8_21_14_0_10_42_8]